MKQNKQVFLIALTVLLGCSQEREYPTIIGKLEKASPEEKSLRRGLASPPKNACFKDLFTVDTLKAEVKDYERKFTSGTKVTGKWKHLDLSTLPIPQANFLKTYGALIGDRLVPDSIDYSSCKTLPCIINKIYGKDEDYIAGYVHYVWYLKLGHLLAPTNFVYDSIGKAAGVYNGKAFQVSSYLYNEKELYAFWRLLHMVKSPFTELSQMKEIHRVPRGENFDFVEEERKQLIAQGKTPSAAMTCGLAYSSGYVIMQDLCLSLYSDLESGNFYASVNHELGHEVDYYYGRKKNQSYRSQDQDYLDVSGFYINEYKDTNGQVVRQWAQKPGTKLVTWYAGTSPQENYAETLAYFRHMGNHTKGAITEDHWNYTSKNYYDNKFYDNTNLVQDWQTAYANDITQSSFKGVGDCANSTTAAVASTYFKKTDFPVPVTTGMLNCLGNKAQQISRDMLAQVKAVEPQGCAILDDDNTKKHWDPAIKKKLIEVMSKYVLELEKDKDYFAKIQSFLNEIDDQTMAKKAYLTCANETNEEDCYKSEVRKLAISKLAPLGLPEEHAGDLADTYLNQHPIASIRQYLFTYYQAFVSSHREIILKGGEELWATCLSVPQNDDASPVGKYLQIADGYMISSLYNCINSQFPDKAREIARSLDVDGTTVQHPKEEVILIDQVIPQLQKVLADLYLSKQKEELDAAAGVMESQKDSLRATLVSDFSWVKDVLNTEKITSDCKKLALSKIDFLPLYNQKSVLFGPLSSAVCQGIQDSTEYSNWLEQSHAVFESKSLDALENLIYKYGTEQAKVCLKKYPIDSNLSRVKFKDVRDACLVSEWPAIEKRSLSEFANDPLVIKFNIKTDEMRSKLVTNRRRIQLKVMKENF